MAEASLPIDNRVLVALTNKVKRTFDDLNITYVCTVHIFVMGGHYKPNFT